MPRHRCQRWTCLRLLLHLQTVRCSGRLPAFLLLALVKCSSLEAHSHTCSLLHLLCVVPLSEGLIPFGEVLRLPDGCPGIEAEAWQQVPAGAWPHLREHANLPEEVARRARGAPGALF